jgi:hypothetical protein
MDQEQTVMKATVRGEIQMASNLQVAFAGAKQSIGIRSGTLDVPSAGDPRGGVKEAFVEKGPSVHQCHLLSDFTDRAEERAFCGSKGGNQVSAGTRNPGRNYQRNDPGDQLR